MATKVAELKAVLETATVEIEASGTVEKLVQAGTKAWQALSRWENIADEWYALDALMKSRADVLCAASPLPTALFHHGTYLPPTAFVGQRVYAWLPRVKKPLAADVTAIQDPGRVEVRLIRGSTDMAIHPHLVCNHASDPSNATDPHLSKWDALPGDEFQDSAYELALEKIARRERNVIAGVKAEKARIEQARASRRESKKMEGATTA